MLAKFAEDDRIEQMNAQKRRIKQLEHRKAVEKLIEDRRKQFLADKVRRAFFPFKFWFEFKFLKMARQYLKYVVRIAVCFSLLLLKGLAWFLFCWEERSHLLMNLGGNVCLFVYKLTPYRSWSAVLDLCSFVVLWGWVLYMAWPAPHTPKGACYLLRTFTCCDFMVIGEFSPQKGKTGSVLRAVSSNPK